MCVCVSVKWVVSVCTILNPHYMKPFIQVDGAGVKAQGTDVQMAIKQFTFLVNLMVCLT